MNAWAICYKTRPTALYCMCGGVSKFTSVSRVDNSSVPLHAYNHPQYRNNAEGPSSAYGANTGDICHTHMHLNLLHANHHGYGPFGFCLLANIIVMTRDWLPPVGSHWLFAPGWWCHHVWHVAVDVALRHALLGMDRERIRIRSKLEVCFNSLTVEVKDPKVILIVR